LWFEAASSVDGCGLGGKPDNYLVVERPYVPVLLRALALLQLLENFIHVEAGGLLALWAPEVDRRNYA
jgi:hypothetical protein